MALCAKCNAKVEDGATRCPSCDAALSPGGSFTEVVGWVLLLASIVPLLIGEKTLEQRYYPPIIGGAAVLVLGIVLVVVGRGKSKAAPAAVREEPPKAA